MSFVSCWDCGWYKWSDLVAKVGYTLEEMWLQARRSGRDWYTDFGKTGRWPALVPLILFFANTLSLPVYEQFLTGENFVLCSLILPHFPPHSNSLLPLHLPLPYPWGWSWGLRGTSPARGTMKSYNNANLDIIRLMIHLDPLNLAYPDPVINLAITVQLCNLWGKFRFAEGTKERRNMGNWIEVVWPSIM